MSQTATYTDGLSVRIAKMTQGKITETGPGAFPGRPVTRFSLVITNGTKRSLSFDSVVVTVTYGHPARLAYPVYGGNLHDFAGAVKPGHAADAVYEFTIPTADLGNVSVTVDLDGTHQLVTFAGRAQ